MIYVRYLLRALNRHGGFRAILAVSEASLVHPQVTEMIDEFGESLILVAVTLPEISQNMFSRIHPMLAKQFAFFGVLQRLISSWKGDLKIDYVFVPFLDDYCLLPLALRDRPFGKIPWGGIVISPRHHLRQLGVILPWRWQDYVEQLAYRQLWRKKALDQVFCIDPYFEQFYPNAKLDSVPDPSDLLFVAPQDTCFGIKQDAVVLLVYGYIDQRKAIDRLLEAMTDERIPDSLTLLLVGKQDPPLRPLLESEVAQYLRTVGRLIEINRIVSDSEEAAAFRRTDVVWNYYPRNYCSSGALVRAGQSSRPVLATREGVVGRTVADLGMGLLVGEDDREGLILALVRFSSDAELREKLGKAGFEHFAKASAAAFGDPIIAHIAQTLVTEKC
ncbi:MAG: glycosyltransferase family 4 protein [Methylovulum sp.]|nr:glycosyltransferase family 4 protein [Methylovulum sp.]